MLSSLLIILQTITSQDTAKAITLKDSLREDVVVTAVRASSISPVTQYNMSKVEIAEKNQGQDFSFLLNKTPSIVAQSDAGNGFGYSYFRMRGIDQTRINFNINGIPVNDPETQGVYTNNFADLASSAQSIQIQRGAGTTANGSAPIAGSVNILTNDLRGPAMFGLSSGIGSFNSTKVTAEYGTGILKNGLAFYGRLSSLKSDGYRYNSNSDLKTYFVSGGFFGKRSILKFNIFGGITRTSLAFNPIDKDTYLKDRRSNSLTPLENDEFQQTFYQLQYSYKLNSRWNISSSAYYVKGIAPKFAMKFPGWYDYSYYNMTNPIIGGDTLSYPNALISYRLDQHFLGAMAFLNYSDEKLALNFGIHGNTFKSAHFMEVLSAQVFPDGFGPGQQAYYNTGYKNELSAFAKANYYATDNFMLFADIQIRNASFSYNGTDKAISRDTFSVERMNWTFLNPKAGMRFFIDNKQSIYASAGLVTREPTRSDYLNDDRANFNIKQADVKPEQLLNIEAGYSLTKQDLRLGANVYLMEFRNEIAATGAINTYGYAIRQNVNNSFRRGLEISSEIKMLPGFWLITDASVSYNRIKEFTQTFSVYDSVGYPIDSRVITYKNVNPVLTPGIIINQGIRILPVSWLTFDVSGRYVGKTYLDNTNNENLTVPDYALLDLKFGMKLAKFFKYGEPVLNFFVNNATNTYYSPAGTPTHNFKRDVNGNDQEMAVANYFPAATRNFFVSLSMKF